MKKTISIFFPLFFALCTFCESANADVRIGLPRVTVPISPDIRVVPQPQYVEPTIVVPLPGYYYYDYPGYYYPVISQDSSGTTRYGLASDPPTAYTSRAAALCTFS